MVNFKGKRVISFVVMVAVLTTLVSFTLPVSAEDEGTVLWSENFDGLTQGRDGWSAIVGNYADGTLTHATVDGTNVTWEMAANNYTSKVAFADGKLVLGQMRNTEHGSEVAQLSIPLGLDTATGRPAGTGYLILEYDYLSNALPIRSRYNERHVASDLMLTESASGRTYAKVDITSTNGIQSMMGTSIGSADEYTSVAAGTHKNNVRRANDISGKTVHMALIFDVVNTQYNVAALVDGEYSFLNWEWVDYTGDQHKDWFFNKLTLTQSECNAKESTWTEVSYDNFVLKQYETLPEWAVAPVPPAPVVSSSTPANNGTDVDTDAVITVEFDKDMDADSLDDIKLHKDSVSGTEIELTKTVADNLRSVSFTHATLYHSTDYYLVIPTTVKSDDDIAFEEQVVIKFTTSEVEPIIPNVVSTTIAETGMGLTEPFKILFDTTIDFNTLSGVTLHKGSAEGTTVALTPSMSTDKLATYFSHAPLDYNTTYVLSIPQTVMSSTKGAFAGATYTFTTISRTKQHDNVKWLEDFDTRTGWNETERRAGWGMLLWETVNGVSSGISGYNNMGDRDNTKRAKAEFREGGLLFTRPQDYEGTVGNNYVNLKVPFTGYSISDTADYVAVEFDYYQSDSFNSKYSGDVRIVNSDEKVVFQSGFGSAYYGYQYKTYDALNPSNFTAYPEFYDLLKSYTPNDDTVNAHELPRGDISNDESHWIGKNIDVQVLFDIQNRKYIVNYVSDGTRYTARSGWQDMIPGVNLDLAWITLTSVCNPSSGKPVVTTKFDNLAVVEYNAPHVAQTSIEAGSNIETDEPVTITFTEPMMEDTLEDITLKKGSADVVISDFELSLDGKTVTLICDELDNGADYTLTVPATVMSRDYFALEAPHSVTFRTMEVTAVPDVKELSFTDGATEVDLDRTFSVTFNKPMDKTSLESVTLEGDNGSSVMLTVTMSNNNKTATFSHDGLEYGVRYTLTIPTTVKSQDGVFVAEQIEYTFTTETAPTPPVIMSASITDGETGVPVTSEFTFTFDKAMNTSTFDNITLVKVEGEEETSVSLYPSASNGDKTVKLGHPKLENGKQYKLTIPTTVKSVIGLGVASETVYTFSTATVVEGETLLYSEYFDTAIGGATETQANYSGNGWNIYSKVENQTAFSDTNKVEFKGGKMVITKEQRIPAAVSTNYPESENAIYATLDLSTSASMPETGVVAIEYDINYSKKPQATMWYTDTTVSTNTNGNSAYEITRLCFSSGSYGWNDKSVTNDVNSGTVITPNEWLQGKDIHVKLVYNLDERTYSMFYTVDGVTYQSPVGVAPFRDQITSTKIAKLAFSFVYRYYDDNPIIITLDNIEVKKLTKPVVDTNASSVVNGQSGVSATERIKIAFNANMNTDYFKDIKVYEGIIAPQNLVNTTSVVEDEKTCYIYLDKGLKYSTAYIIDVPSSVVSTNLIPIVTTDITFTTEAPTVGYEVEFLSVKNGSGITVTDIRGLTSVKAEVLFTNEMCACLKAPKLVIALCDSEGNIKSVSYRETPMLIGSLQNVTASFTSTTPFELGDYIKAFVLDGTTGSLMSQEVIYNQ